MDRLMLRALAEAAQRSPTEREPFLEALSPEVVLDLLDDLRHAEDVLARARAHWAIIAGPPTTVFPSGMHKILSAQRKRGSSD